MNDTPEATDPLIDPDGSAARRRPAWRRHLIVLLILLAATVVMTWPLTIRLTRHIPQRTNNYDNLFNAHFLAWGARCIRRLDVTGLWHAPSYYPFRYGLTYSDHLLGFQPIVLPVYAASGNILLAYNITQLLSFVLVGYCTYLLVRHLCRSAVPHACVPRPALPGRASPSPPRGEGRGEGSIGSRHGGPQPSPSPCQGEGTGRGAPGAAFAVEAAAVVAGLALAVVPYRFQHWHHVQLLVFWWMPLTLLCLHRLIERPAVRWGLAVGAGFSMQMLMGMYHGTYLALLGLLFLLYFVPLTGVWRRGRFWAALVAAGLLFAVTNGPILLMYARGHTFSGLSRSADTIAWGGLAIDRYLRVHPTNRLLPLLGVAVPPDRSQFVAWLGAVVGFLACAGVVRSLVARNRRLLRIAMFYVLAGAFFWVASLGTEIRLKPEGRSVPGLYGLLVRIVPGFRGMRYPSRMSVMVSVCLTVLAGLGLAFILLRIGRVPRPDLPGRAARTRRRAQRISAVGVAVLILAEFWVAPTWMERVSPDRDTLALCTWLADQPPESVVAHFPANGVRDEIRLQRQYYMYLCTFHWRRIVRSGLGEFPPVYPFMRHQLGDFPARDCIDLLQAIGVTHVVVFPWTDESRTVTPDDVADARLVDRVDFGSAAVFRVTPCRWGRVPSEAFRIPSRVPAGASIRAAVWFGERPTLRLLGDRLQDTWLIWEDDEGRQFGGTPLSALAYDRLAALSGRYVPIKLRAPGKPGSYRVVLSDQPPAKRRFPWLRRPATPRESGRTMFDVQVVPHRDAWTDETETAPRAALDVTVEPPDKARAGQVYRLRILLTNTSGRTWACRSGRRRRPAHAVRLAWFMKRGDDVVKSGRAHLPCDLAPGQSIDLAMRVEMPDEPGRYLLTIDPVMKAPTTPAIWFNERGNIPWRREIEVTADE